MVQMYHHTSSLEYYIRIAPLQECPLQKKAAVDITSLVLTNGKLLKTYDI